MDDNNEEYDFQNVDMTRNAASNIPSADDDGMHDDGMDDRSTPTNVRSIAERLRYHTALR